VRPYFIKLERLYYRSIFFITPPDIIKGEGPRRPSGRLLAVCLFAVLALIESRNLFIDINPDPDNHLYDQEYDKG